MKSDLTPKQQALAAIDAVIKSPHALRGFRMPKLVLDLFWEPGASLYAVSETLDALIELMELADKHKYTNAAGNQMLSNMKTLLQCLRESRQNQAEVQKWVIEANDDVFGYDPFLTDEHLLNIARKFELFLELDRLESERRDLDRAQDEKREAA
jgi:hypothetical protein